jgi:hypothetical protein
MSGLGLNPRMRTVAAIAIFVAIRMNIAPVASFRELDLTAQHAI